MDNERWGLETWHHAEERRKAEEDQARAEGDTTPRPVPRNEDRTGNPDDGGAPSKPTRRASPELRAELARLSKLGIAARKRKAAERAAARKAHG